MNREEIREKWQSEKEAKPLLYVIDEEEIDYLLSECDRLEARVKELKEGIRKFIGDKYHGRGSVYEELYKLLEK